MSKMVSVDVGRVNMRDGTCVDVRLSCRGYLPSDMGKIMEQSIAESLSTYLKDSKHTLSGCEANTTLLTEILEMELSELEYSHKAQLRYTRVTFALPMHWKIEVHLEEASAPCVIDVEIYRNVDI